MFSGLMGDCRKSFQLRSFQKSAFLTSSGTSPKIPQFVLFGVLTCNFLVGKKSCQQWYPWPCEATCKVSALNSTKTKLVISVAVLSMYKFKTLKKKSCTCGCWKGILHKIFIYKIFKSLSMLHHMNIFYLFKFIFVFSLIGLLFHFKIFIFESNNFL